MRLTTATVLFIAVLLPAPAAEPEPADLLPGIEWGEVDDYLQPLRDLEAWQLNLSRAGIWELATMPGLDADKAALLLAQLRKAKQAEAGASPAIRPLSPAAPIPGWLTDSFFNRRPVDISSRFRAGRRYGRLTGDEGARYDGSPLGLTQRLQVGFRQYQAGLSLDKDRYEPNLDDLTRFYGSYRDGDLTFLAGDFHLTALNGVTLGGPNYAFNWDLPSAFFNRRAGVMPAVDVAPNSARRGGAAEGWRGGLQVMAFAADTRLDAICDDSGKVLRLSDSGLHRTEGEAQKRNAARERAAGGALIRHWGQAGKTTVSAGIAGYTAEFQDAFAQPPDPRFPSPLLGNRVANVGFGMRVATGLFLGTGEIAADRDGHPAFQMALSQGWQPTAGSKWRGYISLFQYPADYHNPHSGSLPGVDSKNAEGGAVLLNVSRKAGFIRDCRLHWELVEHPSRTYSIPRPYTATASSAALQLRLPHNLPGEAELKLKNSNGWDVVGAGSPPERFGSHRLRLTYKQEAAAQRIKLWGEVGYWRLVRDPVKLSAMWGTTYSRQFASAHNAKSRWRYYITACRFATAGRGALYLGEGELPDRLAAVRLAGRGVRLSGVAVWRQNSGNLILLVGIQIARTIQDRSVQEPVSGDLEAYLTASFNYKIQTEF